LILHLASLVASTTTTATTAKSSGSILDPIAKPVAGVLAFIYSIVPNYGVAILVLSVIWMVIISPLTLKSTRSMLAMQQLQPQLKALQEKHKDDRQAFAQAQMELFREHNVSPFGSCLPMLLPLPVFFALFRVITGLSHIGKNGVADPKYLNHSTRMFKDIVASHGHLNAFGLDLSRGALHHHSSVAAALPYWILLLIMAGTSYLQTAQTMSRNPQAANNPQMRVMKFLPLIFVVFVINFPAGVVLYYCMSNVCRIVQQDLMYRFDPKVKALVADEVREVEAITRDIDEHPERARGQGGVQAPPKGGDGAGKRTRFRDLLAAAAEQQKTQQAKQKELEAKNPPRPAGGGGGAGGSGTGSGTGGGTGSSQPKAGPTKTPASGNASGNGAPQGGTSSNGAKAGRPGTNGQRGASRPRSGSRRNRRRRGR
jgi:YidC/Oxa1 family membrane protein insertase